MEGISYYECKVMTDGKESGYVLVNVNGSDVQIREASEEWTTLSEYFEEITGIDKEEIEVYRYGYTASAAFQKEDEQGTTAAHGIGAVRKPLATMDLPEDFDFNGYRQAVKENKGSLTTEVVEMQETFVAREMTGRGNAEVYLIRSWDSSAPTSTPKWTQFERRYSKSGKSAAVGCGAVAHALVLAYWQQNKGCYGLLYNGDLTFLREQEKISFIFSIADVLETVPVGRYGYTPTHKMKKIVNYLEKRDYKGEAKERFGGYDNKFNGIYDSLAEDRSVILLINSKGIGAMNHYVVVEHAKRVPGSNAYIRYYCNFDWGDSQFYDPKQIFGIHMKRTCTVEPTKRKQRHSLTYLR